MSQQINVKKNSKQKTPNKQNTTDDKKQNNKQKTPNKELQDLLNVKFGNLSIDNRKSFQTNVEN